MNVTQVCQRRQLPPPALRRALRQAAGLTQDDIADHLGVSRAAVSRWESGDRAPRINNRERYAALLRLLANGAAP